MILLTHNALAATLRKPVQKKKKKFLLLLLLFFIKF